MTTECVNTRTRGNRPTGRVSLRAFFCRRKFANAICVRAYPAFYEVGEDEDGDGEVFEGTRDGIGRGVVVRGGADDGDGESGDRSRRYAR